MKISLLSRVTLASLAAALAATLVLSAASSSIGISLYQFVIWGLSSALALSVPARLLMRSCGEKFDAFGYGLGTMDDSYDRHGLKGQLTLVVVGACFFSLGVGLFSATLLFVASYFG
ncbi:hypothetical protein LNV23_10745 [Paucibacter sp. DJ1R-11]|uniref:hypothetical protein n=1 Tax=Paucibacter sp. DJ1R-11 TaxID=2893556 RepID=UPI0021E3EDE7|nr:hypothetical protein [Paucibacter sp. DJ1R-11]MCV2363925.1 hypothetical protein [Paucibacter sp. DJ1R-11]